MVTIRKTSLGLWVGFLLCAVLLFLFKDGLEAAHLDGGIDYVAADAGTYFTTYRALFAQASLGSNPELFLVGAPFVFLSLADGHLIWIQAGELLLMALTLQAGATCFTTARARAAFLAGAFLFPYFLVGFLSINKEIFAMCSAVFYATWFVRGKLRHLALALLLAMCARYYMVLALLALALLVPRERAPRYLLMFLMLLAISLAAPFVKLLVPGYSGEGLLDDAPAASGVIFSRMIDGGAYLIAYPLKYLVLIPTRAYSFLIDPGRLANRLEGLVSLISLAMLGLALAIPLLRKRSTAQVRSLIVMGLVAPMPIMWTEIMHWRYFSFVYYFFLMAVVLHGVELPRTAGREQQGSHA